MASSNPETEYNSRSESDSDDENVSSEKMNNPLSKWRKVKIANASDEPAWVGIQAEREISQGGAEYHFELAGQFGMGLKNSTKEHHLISRIPWQKAWEHEVTTIRYRSDKFFGSQARLVILQSRVEMAQELIIKGSEKIIIGHNGRISFSTNEDIVPIDTEGNDLNERKDKKTYAKERNRQKLWIPEDVPGRVKDITLDPYIKRSFKKKDDRFSEANNDTEHVRSEKDTKRSGLDGRTSP